MSDFSTDFSIAFGSGSVTPPPPPPNLVSLAGQTYVMVSNLHVLQLFMAEDAYNGDAQMTVSINGTRAWAEPISVQATHGNQQQVFTIVGNWRTPPKVNVSFTNDAYGGVGKDRNLYLLGAAYDNVPVAVTHKFGSNSSYQFTA